VEQECIPSDTVFHAQLGEGEQRWKGHPSIIDDLKERAKKLGLWNMFLPRNHFKEGAGFSNLEYGLMAEYLGKSRVASEVYFPAIFVMEVGIVLTCVRIARQPIAPRQIQATWRFLLNMAPRRKSRNGLLRF
jgi:alkylation response protein AidB-like acyl-CoA dehydrogenase